MKENWTQIFLERIDNLSVSSNPKFGKMNVCQMLCHCADQIRIITNELVLEYDSTVDANEIKTLAREGKFVPIPKGLDQVKNEGTSPTNFENDQQLLKNMIAKLIELPSDYKCGQHPYFGNLDKEPWQKLVIYHLNHHLTQFEV
jgi:Protein of unknown function (DUF1569)